MLVSVRNNFNVGDDDTFWIVDTSKLPPEQFQITANVAYRTEHSYWWVDNDFEINEDDLINSAEKFETKTYPTNHAYFGTEWSPGIDNDYRIHILMANVPGVAGYFASSNEYSHTADPYSNQREIILINANIMRPGTTRFDGVIAHEFQHMIHWHLDANEDAWVNEGLSELAEFVNGHGQSNFLAHYLTDTDLQLTSWGRTDSIRLANYGASFLFLSYFYDRFGQDAIRQLVAQPRNGVFGFEQALHDIKAAVNFDQLFADFALANYLNNISIGDGMWGYNIADIEIHGLMAQTNLTMFPVEQTELVHQYGVDYVAIKPETDTDLTITFEAPTTVPLINNQAHGGSYQWYSNRGDECNTHLTRAFDLSNLTQATLTFWAWYDIEQDWDYAYITVSSDSGKTWDILPASSTTDVNPVGNSYGHGFTGMSGNGSSPTWQQEIADLSPYIGQEILIRFEHISDDAVNLQGLAIDDIQIPELDYFHSAEDGDDGWQAKGFIRTDNILEQRFIIYIIEFDTLRNPTVNRMLLDKNNRGEYTLHGFGPQLDEAILVISGQAMVTTTPARYKYIIR
ncbi:MAG: hypothetical protein B6242_14690 [Anaerolineaceae bacterium 4572_78]|nr:MAG: hypothetical protein B6242_14690 [Anaerolineaceae bacterium 4572_78]